MYTQQRQPHQPGRAPQTAPGPCPLSKAARPWPAAGARRGRGPGRQSAGLRPGEGLARGSSGGKERLQAACGGRERAQRAATRRRNEQRMRRGAAHLLRRKPALRQPARQRRLTVGDVRLRPAHQWACERAQGASQERSQTQIIAAHSPWRQQAQQVAKGTGPWAAARPSCWPGGRWPAWRRGERAGSHPGASAGVGSGCKGSLEHQE